MEKHFPKIFLFLFFLNPCTLLGQYEGLAWVAQLAEKVVEETDLCERCTWVNPTISYVRLSTAEFIFLRYSCSTQESFARMYNLNGGIEGECTTKNGISDCDFGGDAFIIYTFADKILQLWNCSTGFDCAFALENNIELEVPISVDDSRCTEGIKILTASDEFTTYEWEGNDQSGNMSTLEITEGGQYKLTVTDEMGCTFKGAIDIPDIAKLEVSIKGPAQFCLGTEVELKTTNFATYQWTSGETESSIMANQAGTYFVTVTNDQDCEGLASFNLGSFPTLPIEIVAEPPTVFEGDSVNLSILTPSNDQSITVEKWTSKDRIDCSSCPEATYYPSIENELSVAIIDENGCTSQANFSMTVKELTLDVYTPNIFRPNTTFENSRFTLYGGANILRIESLTIIDRWGNSIYHKTDFLPNDENIGWDGQVNGEDAQQDVYLFQFEVLFRNGERKVIGGDLFLMR